MSYEGYSQFWCKNGHYWTIDCNELFYKDVKERCPICSEHEVFQNMVNVTNGSFDDDGTRIDGFIDPILKKENKLVCKSCKKEKTCGCSIYKIPKRCVKQRKSEVGK